MIIDVPKGVPQSNEFSGLQMYVRDCYPKYYDDIMAELHSGSVTRLISVTGTPGIGKSLFYLYFFSKHRTEHPGEKVLTASFSKDRKLKKCKVWNAVNDTTDNTAGESFKNTTKSQKTLVAYTCTMALQTWSPRVVAKWLPLLARTQAGLA